MANLFYEILYKRDEFNSGKIIIIETVTNRSPFLYKQYLFNEKAKHLDILEY